jgi:hypothetical protein
MRGPKLFNLFRQADRKCNGIENFPNLFYPELYVLCDGYSKFFSLFPELCDGGYIKMHHPSYTDERTRGMRFIRAGRRDSAHSIFGGNSSTSGSDADDAASLAAAAAATAGVLSPSMLDRSITPSVEMSTLTVADSPLSRSTPTPTLSALHIATPLSSSFTDSPSASANLSPICAVRSLPHVSPPLFSSSCSIRRTPYTRVDVSNSSTRCIAFTDDELSQHSPSSYSSASSYSLARSPFVVDGRLSPAQLISPSSPATISAIAPPTTNLAPSASTLALQADPFKRRKYS